MKSWLIQGSLGRRVTLLPRTNFLHLKVTPFGLHLGQPPRFWDTYSEQDSLDSFHLNEIDQLSEENPSNGHL